MPEIVQIVTTIDDREAAGRLGRRLVEERLVACCQVVGPIRSIYRWKGTVEETDEWYCVMKTRPSLYRQVEEAIRRLVDCPALLVATEGDAYSALSASTLKQAAPVFAELRTWPGASHGVDLFAAHPESMHFILQWLRSILDGK